MTNVFFTSRLDASHRDELERLLFFNGNQARVSEGVEFVARKYGIPRVNVAGNSLNVELASDVCTQTLFVARRSRSGTRPVGVVIYTREKEALVVLFVAVHEDYSSRGRSAASIVLVRIVAELKSIALRVRGIQQLVLYVGRAKPTRIKIRRPTS